MGMVYAFGKARLDVSNVELTVDGQSRPLEPKSFRLLRFLVENRHRVTSKEEIFATVWEGVSVSDNALTRAITQIRKALEDDAKEPRYIETVPTIGYRFIADVRVLPPQPGALAPSIPDAPPTPAGKEEPHRFPWPRLGAVAALLLVTTGAWWYRASATRPLRLVDLRPLTTASASEFWPSFSPDGSQVAFSSNRTGPFEIFIASLAPGSDARALTQDGAENFQPAWSPDGRFIAYVSRKRRGIWVIPVTGGVARRVTDHGDSPAWAPNGNFLTFREGALEMNPGLETSQTPGVTIWMVGADGSGAHPLTSPNDPPGAHNYPRWTPDGKQILFAEMLAPPFNQVEIIRKNKDHLNAFASFPWVVDVASRRLQPIDIDATVVRSPAISPDGRRMYYIGAGSGQQPGVWQARLDGLHARSSEPLVPGAGLIARDLFLSPDGKHVAFGQQSGESAIWSVRLASDGTASGDPVPILRDRAYRNTEFTYSRDGSRIAYTKLLQSGEASVNVMQADGSNSAPISARNDAASRPSWRADGSLGYRAIHNGAIGYFLLPPGGDPQPLNLKLDVVNGDRFRFSPDGNFLAAHITTRGKSRIAVEDLRTHAVRDLTPSDADCSFPIWSPDGRWLGMQVRSGGKVELAYMPATGGPIRKLVTGFTQSMGNDWSPDSSRIAFAGLDDGVWNIYTVSIADSTIRQLTHFTSRSAFVRYTAWSPKGDAIVFEHNTIGSSIYVADLK